MNSRLIVIVFVVLIAGSIFWLLLTMRASLPNPAANVSDPCPDQLLINFLAGDKQAIAEALGKTANTLEQALRNPDAVCFLSYTGADIFFLPETIGRLSNVRYINLTDDKLASLPPQIGELKRLTVLDLNDNDITSLPGDLYTLTGLETLALVRNKLTEVPDTIAKLSALKHLYLTGNPLTQGQIDRVRSLLPHTEVDF